MNFMSIWNLNDCTSELSTSEQSINPCLAFYLAGLIEGDGTIVVPTQERSKKGKLNYASIKIAFQTKDFPVAILIKKILGHGSIIKKKNAAAYIYTINNLEGLILIANSINGKIRGSKHNQFIKLVNYIKYKSSTFSLSVLPPDTSCIGQNG